MLPPLQKIVFLLFALVMVAAATYTWRRMFLRIAAGRQDSDARFNHLPRRIWYSLKTTLTQRRTFRKRPVVSFFHSLIFYGFVFYVLVNSVDVLEGFFAFNITSSSFAGATYNFLADLLSALVLLAVIALVARRFLLPSRRDFLFNGRTLLHPDVKSGYVRRDSVIVSTFILVHVGSRAIGAAAKLSAEGSDRLQPFASLISHLFSAGHADAWRVAGYWGALGSVLAFLAYFPRTKHVHIFMASAKYTVARDVSTGVLPVLELDTESDQPALGANRLEELAWPRLLDAYACIQCNRCQDVCPATATGKSLSPSALEINKRMELNDLDKRFPAFESGAPSPKPLLQFALSPEAAWACTTCGACMEVCPVQDEPMLDIIDIRRHQVMIEGEFPTQLQSAFRGMERSANPWGLSQDKRLEWASGLNVKTTEENPHPDVLYWVGCAASYDPQAQKTARAFVQLLDHAKVDYAVLGKRECCTGDSARRSGNEFLYRQLADKNVGTLNELKPKLIVATCPHCMNSIGKEYGQIGGDYKVVHHTEFLERLVNDGKLASTTSSSTIAFHDPCYLGRHNGVYDAPRNLLNVLSNSVVELDRNRESSFCCGAGGAQFWKEEEPGNERISDNRYREAEERLSGADDKVLAVGCPFCKSMLQSTPEKGSDSIRIKDVAELLWEGIQQSPIDRPGLQAHLGEVEAPAVIRVSVSTTAASLGSALDQDVAGNQDAAGELTNSHPPVFPNTEYVSASPGKTRKLWVPRRRFTSNDTIAQEPSDTLDLLPESLLPTEDTRARKVWAPKRRFDAIRPPDQASIYEPSAPGDHEVVVRDSHTSSEVSEALPDSGASKRQQWKPKARAQQERIQAGTAETSAVMLGPELTPTPHTHSPASPRKRWMPKRKFPPSER